MAFLKLSEIIQGGQLCLSTFGHLFMLLPRVPEPKMVVISLLALKWQFFKVEALIFSSISLHKKRKKSMLQLWRPVISRLVEISLPTLTQKPLTLIQPGEGRFTLTYMSPDYLHGSHMGLPGWVRVKIAVFQLISAKTKWQLNEFL